MTSSVEGWEFVSLIIKTIAMPVTLDQIVAATRRRVMTARQAADLSQLERAAEAHRARGFRHGLKAAANGGVAIIAELKKASPSRGLIRADFNAAALAREFERSSAAALSVLTDEEFFQGSLQNLRLASTSTTLPCLRKDFIVDEFQLLEALAYGADAVLLIVAALSQEELVGLAMQSRIYGLDVLCEVHDEEELQRALDAGCNLIGVNSRDLRTFQVDLATAFRLAEQIPKNVVSVAESGIGSGHDVARLRAAGYQAFLIGESLMKAESPGQALRELLEAAKTPMPVSTEN
jgi:indole-3-glycerol phosphate synthase